MRQSSKKNQLETTKNTNSATTSTTVSSPMGVDELLQVILMNLPFTQQRIVRQVSKQWQDAIENMLNQQQMLRLFKALKDELDIFQKQTFIEKISSIFSKKLENARIKLRTNIFAKADAQKFEQALEILNDNSKKYDDDKDAEVIRKIADILIGLTLTKIKKTPIELAKYFLSQKNYLFAESALSFTTQDVKENQKIFKLKIECCALKSEQGFAFNHEVVARMKLKAQEYLNSLQHALSDSNKKLQTHEELLDNSVSAQIKREKIGAPVSGLIERKKIGASDRKSMTNSQYQEEKQLLSQATTSLKEQVKEWEELITVLDTLKIEAPEDDDDNNDGFGPVG